MALEKIKTGTTTGDRTGDGAKTAGIKINANFEYLENKIDNMNQLLVDAGFSLSGNVLTINAGWQWKINGINYTNPVAVAFTIPFAAVGKKRRDIIVMNTSNTFTKFVGAEVTGTAVTPALVAQTILLEVFNISESNIYNSKSAAPFLGSITPASVPTGSGAAYWHATQAGTYTNFGSVVVAANSFAVISRNEAGGFSISQTALDLTNYASKSYVDGVVVGLLDDRGSYNASVNTFPTTGGSGASGAVMKGDLWYVNVAGTLAGKAVKVGSSFRALVDAPAQVAANWSILDGNLGYVPENADNKSGDIAADPTSTEKFPTNKAVAEYVAANAGKIKPFIDGAWPVDSQVNSLGKDWYNTVATVAGEIPGTSIKWVERLSGYLTKDSLLILKSCIVTGRPEAAQTFYYLRVTNSNIASETALLTTETLKLSLDVLSDDSNISGIAVFFVNSLGNVYSGTLSYGTVGSSKSYLVDSGQIAKNITGTPEIYIRVFYTDPTIVSTIYLSNIRLFAGNTDISFDAFNEGIFQQNDFSKSFFMPSLAPMNKEISISNDFDVQSFVKLNKWYKKKLNCLGDSITEVNGQATVKYYQHLLVWNNLSRVRQYGYSGRCIGKKNSGDTDCMSVMYASMDDDVDLITVFGGTNDWHLSEYGLGVLGDTTNITFYGALDVLIKGLTAKYPTKTIAFFTPLQRTQTGSYPARNLEDYANAMIAVCRKYSIPCLDLYHSSGFCPAIQGTTYSSDGLHPNNAGHLILAKKIYSFLNSL